MFDALRQRLHLGGPPELIAEGRIIEIQKSAPNGHEASMIEFTLDTRSDLTFRQTVSPLSPEYKRGEAVRVHYEPARDQANIAVVHWIERQ
jgi:hypothetical protein